MLLITLLDNINRGDLFPGHGDISGGPEKGTSRNRRCGGLKSPPRLRRSTFSAIYQCYYQGIDAMAFSTASLCVFIIIIIIISNVLTDHEALPHMATNDDEYNGYYIPKGTICLPSSWSV